MMAESHTCDDETLLLENTASRFSAKRVLPGVCSLTLLAAAGVGGHAVWQSNSNVNDVISRHEVPDHGYGYWHNYWPSHWNRYPRDYWQNYWHDYPRFDDNGCSWDGHDCSFSRCCARQGSKCYVKDARWASCNETCLPFSTWQGSYHHGHWVHTSHPVWDCSELTSDVPTHAVAVEADDDVVRPAPADEAEQKLLTRHEGVDVPPRPLWYPPPPEFWPAPEYYTATVYGGCQEDGLDCRYSRCCARQGSRCFVKNNHWASCNETCFSHSQWEGPHHHGSWKRTNYPVWDCTDITTEDNVHAAWTVGDRDLD